MTRELRAMLARLPARALRVPVTLTAIGLLWVFGAATGALLSGPDGALLDAVGQRPGLPTGRWWTPLTSLFWCANLAGYVGVTVLLAAVVAPAERRLGPVRVLVVLATTQIAGTVTAAALVAGGADAGLAWYAVVQDEVALGPTAGIAGIAVVLSARMSRAARRRLRVLVLVPLATMTLYVGSFEDLVRLAGALAGLALGVAVTSAARPRPRLALVGPRPPPALVAVARPGSATTEIRALLAVVVAASAVGPLLALVLRDSFGPLSQLQDRLRAGGGAAAAAALVPVLAMVVVAEGLRRGRRFAWWAAVVLNTALAVLVVADLVAAAVRPAEAFAPLAPLGGRGAYLLFVAPLLLAPLGLLAALVATRRRFDVAAAPGTYRRLAPVAGVALVGTVGLEVVVALLGRPVRELWPVLADVPARYLPTGYLVLPGAGRRPAGPVAGALHDVAGAAFWATVLVAVLLTFWRHRPAPGLDDAARARELLVRHGGSSLSYMTTWPGHTYWFAPDGTSAVAYRVTATVAITTGDPLGPPEAHADAFRGFAEFCRRNGWTACFYSVTDGFRGLAAAEGWSSLQVAEDTVVPLADLRFTGRKWQDVRTALNRAGKSGITAEWCSFAEAPPAVTDQIRSISAEWVAGKGLPEMGFTLGGVAQLADPEVRCLIAVDADRTVHGVVSWLPVYRDGVPVGWTLDFMRRRGTGFPGVMEFLIASSAQDFGRQGAEFLSLSGAPLARVDRTAAGGTAQRVLDLTGRALEPVYGFGSQLAFKAKFQPSYRPLHLVYEDPAALPAIGNAISRAYLPNLTPRQTLRLLGRVLAA